MISYYIFYYTYNSFDFKEGADLDALAASMLTTGFQATNVGLAINEINRMVSCT
jgi:deoxyhypusine synthase